VDLDLATDPRRLSALDPPKMRGMLHAACVPISILAGILLVIFAPTGTARIMGAIFALSVTGMFSASANLHRRTWTDEGWWRARQLDMTAIYLIIAGSYTPLVGLTMDDPWRSVLLLTVWSATAIGIGIRWLPIVPPFGMTTSLYIVVGAMFVPALPKLWEFPGPTGVYLIMAGCIVYLVGGLMLGARVPNPWPATFGYHEVWHVLVTVAVTLHYCVVAFVVFPKL